MKKQHIWLNYRWQHLLALLVLAGGCAESGPPRVAVSGEVLINGSPLENGTITFVPVEETKGPKASAHVENGHYKLARSRGPMVGKLRVEILASQDLGFALDDPEQFDSKAPLKLPQNPISPKFNVHSKLTCEATKGNENRFNFNLPTGKERNQ